jgi:uncharacterized protein YkwD
MLSAAYPTAIEQYLIELINRARANPAGEAARYGIDLNEGLAAGTISTDASQPLAVNPYLVESARKHSKWMIDTDTFSHTGAGGSDPQDRMTAAGYVFKTPWSWAENIALRSFKSGGGGAELFDAIEKDLFVDIGIAGRGHRINLLSPGNNEIGAGAISGQYSYFQAAMVTQDFASSGDQTFLTGVVYTDAIKKDHFYTPGEGMGGVTITATRVADGAVFSAKTWSAGGYTLKLAPGTYKVVASGGPLSKTITYDSVTIGQENVKRDFTPDTSSTPTPTPTPTPKPKPPPPKTAPDTAAPTAAFRAVRKRAASRYYSFTVIYTDNVSVKTSSIGDGDIVVKAPGNYARLTKLVRVDNSADGKTRIATYQVKGPHGHWDRAHNGLYTVWMVSGQVRDTSGNFLTAQQIGAFTVRIPKAVSATPLPPATAPSPKVKRAFAF